jgi:hypothetical protein
LSTSSAHTPTGLASPIQGDELKGRQMYGALCEYYRSSWTPIVIGWQIRIRELKSNLLAFIRDPKCPYDEMKKLTDGVINNIFSAYKSYAWNGKEPEEFNKLLTDFNIFIAKKAAAAAC